MGNGRPAIQYTNEDMYIIAIDEYGDKITVSANKNTMDHVMYDIGWKDARDSYIEEGAIVETYFIN